MSTRKAYSINFKLLMFNEYKDSFYAWIPHSFIHTIVRFIYVVLYNKEPESWIYGLHYFSFFYRLGWDFLGLYISKGDQFNIIDHIFFGFFQDSIYHKYYLGYDYNNLLLYYNFVELKNFFSNQVYLFIFYIYLYSYFFFEFFFIKLYYLIGLNINLIIIYLNIYLLQPLCLILNFLFYYLILLYNILLYTYYYFFFFLF